MKSIIGNILVAGLKLLVVLVLVTVFWPFLYVIANEGVRP